LTGPSPITLDQTLAGLLTRGPVAPAVALAYAAQIAGELRDLHAEGGVHGHVSTTTALVGPAGVRLAPSLAYPGEHAAQRDVEAFGALLMELIGDCAADGPSGRARGPESVLPSAARLAERCKARPPARLLTMQQVYNEVRLLAVLARQYGMDRRPPAPAPERATPPADLAQERRTGWAISIWPWRH